MDFGRGYGCVCGIFSGRNCFAGFGCAGARGFSEAVIDLYFLSTAVAVFFAKRAFYYITRVIITLA